MYSVVLMAALTTGGSTPECHYCGSHGYPTLVSGCYGSAGGFSGYACAGYWHCSGAWWGGWGGCSGCYGCHGCYGCYGCYGCQGWSPGVPMAPVVAPSSGGGATIEKAPPPKPEKKESSLPIRSKLIVELPQDAKLYIDDQLMKTASGKRTFNTPALERGQLYYYIVRAEVEIDGKTYRETKRVLVRAGQEVKASFPELESQLALARR